MNESLGALKKKRAKISSFICFHKTNTYQSATKLANIIHTCTLSLLELC